MSIDERFEHTLAASTATATKKVARFRAVTCRVSFTIVIYRTADIANLDGYKFGIDVRLMIRQYLSSRLWLCAESNYYP